MRRGEDEGLQLVVEDDGVGMPASGGSTGIGQTVVASLLRSMGGRPGTRATITFARREDGTAQAV